MTDAYTDAMVKYRETLNMYEAGFVQRYHTHPVLARFGQTDGHHQFSVAALMLNIHPNPSRDLLIACLTHDVGERFACDLAAPVKRDNPELAEAHADLEESYRVNHFHNANPELNTTDHFWLKAIDMLECYMYASIVCPQALDTKPWKGLRLAIVNRFIELCRNAPAPEFSPRINVAELMQQAYDGRGFNEPPTGGKYV